MLCSPWRLESPALTCVMLEQNLSFKVPIEHFWLLLPFKMLLTSTVWAVLKCGHQNSKWMALSSFLQHTITQSQNHIIVGWFELEGALKIICHGQGYLSLDQVSQSPPHSTELNPAIRLSMWQHMFLETELRSLCQHLWMHGWSQRLLWGPVDEVLFFTQEPAMSFFHTQDSIDLNLEWVLLL